MKAIISNYRMGRRTQTDNQMVLEVEGSQTKESAEKLVGKTVVYKTVSGKEIKGKVTFAHGNKGRVRAIFEKGMPGQSLGKTVELN